ncbi:MAG: hypothetical protein IPK31_13225 [Chitinophagaceae bacterium]|nr:hypothetical protein [Chitinophagaceae bacterium]
MKNVTVFVLLLMAIASSCNSAKDEIAGFIPGTYVREGTNEFGKEYDTLVISIQNKEARQFKIINKWLFARQVDGEAKEPEYKVKETSGIYNTDSKLLEESETLDHYSFDVKEKVLFDGTNKYQKIK